MGRLADCAVIFALLVCCPQIQAEGIDFSSQTAAGHGYSGEAISAYSGKNWPFILTLIGPDKDGKIGGQIEWPTANSIHQIAGTMTTTGLTFTETAYIKKGEAVLNCIYNLHSDGNSITGTYDSCEGGDYGTMSIKTAYDQTSNQGQSSTCWKCPNCGYETRSLSLSEVQYTLNNPLDMRTYCPVCGTWGGYFVPIACADDTPAVSSSTQYQEDTLDGLKAKLAEYRSQGDRKAEMQTLIYIGVFYASKLGQYESANYYYSEALNISLDLADKEAEMVIVNNLGLIYNSQGQYNNALDFYRIANNISVELANQEGEMASLNNIAFVYNNMGRYEKSLENFEKALLIARNLGYQSAIIICINNIGGAFQSLGQPETALENYIKAYNMSRDLEDKEKEIVCLNNIGTYFIAQEQFESALKFFEKALSISQDLADHSSVIEILSNSNLGTIYNYLQQYERALEYHNKALDLSRDLGSRQSESLSLLSIGDVYYSQNQYNTALEYYIDGLAVAKEIDDKHLESMSLFRIGGAYQGLGNSEKALEYYRNTLAIVEGLRGEITISDLKISYAETYEDIYEKIISLLMDIGKTQEAFNYNEHARSRVFLDQLGKVHIDPKYGIDPIRAKQEEALRWEILAGEEGIRTEKAKPESERNQKAIETIEKDITTKRAEYAKILEDLKRVNPEYSSLISVNPLTLEQIQKLLKNSTLIEYFVTEDRALAFIIDEDEFNVETIKLNRSDLRKIISTVRNGTDFRTDLNLSQINGNLESLYTELFAPIRPHIKTKSIIIAPHDHLHYLPFQALFDSKFYLVENYSISYIPSGSVLSFAQQKRKQNQGSALVLGDPKRPDTKALPSAEQEAVDVAQLYGVPSYNRENATETLFRRLADDASIIHLSCHGGYNQFSPLFSLVLLAPDGQNDGNLFVFEIYNIRLSKANLVTLSACQTNLGKLSKGDEVLGLSRALIYSGTPSVVSSLWSVPSVETEDLMVRFNKHLESGMGKGEALRTAQSEMTHTNKRHPYYWAAFCLIGDST